MRTKHALTSEDAHKMMAACKAEAQKNNWKVLIVIVDDAAIPLLLERLDGAGPTTAEVALGKARTAALTRQPTKLWEERVKERLGRAIPGRRKDRQCGSGGVDGLRQKPF
jgi:glc operon protein GlcG